MSLPTYLQPIVDLEKALDNVVSYQISNATCPLYVAFEKPLHRAEIEQAIKFPPSVIWQEYRDTHYTLEAGYLCRETNTAVVGALSEDHT